MFDCGLSDHLYDLQASVRFLINSEFPNKRRATIICYIKIESTYLRQFEDLNLIPHKMSYLLVVK